MVYGQGVGPDQTLTYFLERELNKATLNGLFEVTNCGVSGYNLWNSLTSFQGRPQAFDAVVLVLCNNDADLFGRTGDLQYPNDGHCWLSSALSLTLAQTALQSFKSWLAETPLILSYYSVWDSPIERAIRKTVHQLATELDIPYVDLFEEFQNRGIKSRELHVSKDDSHPSVLAHNLAARALARAAGAERWLVEFNRCETLEEVALALIPALEDSEETEPPRLDAKIRWAFDALADKRTAALRASDDAQRVGFEDAAREVQTKLEAAHRLWETGARTMALAARLSSREHPFSGQVWLIDEAILRAEELAFTAVHGGDAAVERLLLTLPVMERLSGVSGASAATAIEEGLCILSDALDAARSAAAPANWPLAMLPDLDHPGPGLRELEYLADVLGRQAACWKVRMAEVRELQDRLPSDSPRGRMASRAGSSLGDAAGRFLATASYFAAVARSSPYESGDLFTRVDVFMHLRTHRGPSPILDVIVESLAPRRTLVKQGQYVGTTEEFRLLTFRFPVFFLGRVSIAMDTAPEGVSGRRGSVARVELRNPRRQAVVLPVERSYRSETGDLVFPVAYLS